MFGYSLGELGSILAMQGFAGLILFSVYLLMALGLAIIFGQMGVINMAHGEFMILGAYMTYFCSHLFASYLPGLYGGYFFVAMIVAFVVSGAVGLLVEWALIQRLYARPLDTLLATWGLSLIMQQAFRSGFGAREVGVELPPWMMGSLQVTDTIEVQINGLFVMGLTLLITAGVAVLLFRSRWGLQVRSVVANRTMAGAVGIDTRRIDRFTFGLGCGIAGIAGSAFTMIGSTGPTAGQLYIVDTFLVVVFGGAQSLLGTIASALDHFAVAIDAGVFPHRIDGESAHAADRHRHPDAAPAGAVRPQGEKVTPDDHRPPRFPKARTDRHCVDRGPHPDPFAACSRHFSAQSRRQVSDLCVRRHRLGIVLGTHRNPQPRTGTVFRAWRLLHGRLPQA